MRGYENHELFYYVRRLPAELKRVVVIFISDLHYGNPNFSPTHFKRTLELIASNPEYYMILNGDLCESAIKSSKGDVYSQVGTPQDQRDWVIKQLLPLKDRVLAATDGNHERRITREVGFDLTADISAALGCPYRPCGVAVKICFGGGNENHPEKPYTYHIYATHGYGGARTNSAKAVKAERLSYWIHADCYAMSHDHTVNAAPVPYLIPDERSKIGEDGFETGQFREYRKILVKTNAYLKWGGYSEAGGFSPVDLLTPEVIFSGEGKRLVRVLI